MKSNARVCLVSLVLLVSWFLPLRAAEAPPGTKKWEFPTGSGVFSCPAIAADGTVYVGCVAGKVYALDGGTGAKRWESIIGGAVSSPAIGDDGTLYVGSNSGGMSLDYYALDGATGATLWDSFAGPAYSGGLVAIIPHPAVGDDGTVYVGSVDAGSVRALDGGTGAIRWQFITGGAVSHPAIGADGTIYVGSRNKKVYALDGATGRKRWEFPVSDDMAISPAVGVDGTVYVGSHYFWRDPQNPWSPPDERGTFYALNGATGQQLWKTGIDGCFGNPAISPDGTVYVCVSALIGGRGQLYALDRTTGRSLWAVDIGGRTFSSPAVGADGTVYVALSEPLAGPDKILALDGATGAKQWEFEVGTAESEPTIGVDGTLYVGGQSKVYAIATSSVGGLAASPWPKFRADARNTGRVRTSPVNPEPPAIVAQPQNRTNTLSSTATFDATVSGATPLTLQWLKDGTPLTESSRITGTDYYLLTISNVQATDEGLYSLVVSNAFGVATSQEARLTVFQPLPPLSAVVLAGQAVAGFADGPGASAQFSSITSLDLGPEGWVYVADAGNRRIRVVDEMGGVRTLAGTGEDAQRDGPGPQAAFHDLRALSVDGFGNCYVLDGDQLRRVDADGQVSTLETLAIPSGFTAPVVEPPVYAWADTNYLVYGLVASREGRVYLRAVAEKHTDACYGWGQYGCKAGYNDSSGSTVVFEGIGASRTTFASASRSDGSSWDQFSGTTSSGSGAALRAFGRGLGEELLVYRETHDYSSSLPPSATKLQYEVLTLGRTPVVSLTAANLTPAGIAALTRDWVLMHSYGRFSVLAPGWAPIPVASDRAPQVGLAVDGNGLIYSATTNQVLRFIPANTVLLSLRVPEPGAAAVLTVVSPPGWQVRLEQSRDFQDWEPWQTLTSTGLDSLALKPESDRLFLRAVLSP